MTITRCPACSRCLDPVGGPPCRLCFGRRDSQYAPVGDEVWDAMFVEFALTRESLIIGRDAYIEGVDQLRLRHGIDPRRNPEGPRIERREGQG